MKRTKVANFIDRARRENRLSLTEAESKQILSYYGIPVVEETIVMNEDEAVAQSQKTGYPVVLKGLGAKLTHKTERGLVKVNLKSDEEVRDAFQYIKKAAGEDWEACLIQPLVEGKREFVAGLTRDPQFGPTVMFGLGGIYTEALSDVTFRIAPLDAIQSIAMLDEIKARKLLGAFRGEAAVDKKQLFQVLMGLSRLGTDHPAIKEIDINPLIVMPDGHVKAVDALVILADAGDVPADIEAIRDENRENEMEKFFDPQSVVIVGASNTPFNLGSTICNVLKDYLKYTGVVYAVNSKGEDVNGYPGFSSVLDLPGAPDLAVIIVAARNVPAIIRDCAAKGIRRIVIESSGFSEGGQDGAAMQREIDKVAKGSGIRIMGPNCLGTLSTRNKFCCFYGVNPSLVEMSQIFEAPGDISYVIQSGGVAVLVIESLYYDLVGINKVASIGNKCDVDEADLIDYFQKDETKVIGMYLENVVKGRKLMEAAKRSRKPVLIYKVGRTSEGAQAAMSHTAGMANDDRIFESACRQAGIIRLQSIDELHSFPKMFTEMPPLKGKRIAAFTNSGAFGSIAADMLVESGLRMVRLSAQTQEKLKKAGQVFNVKNPVDIGPAPPQTYLDIFEILLSADEVDGLVPLLSIWQTFVIDVLQELLKMCRHYEKPAAIYTPNAIAKSIAIRAKHRIPIFETAGQAVRALSISYDYYDSLIKRDFIRDAALKSDRT
jgi:acyl-CoA synthetase (NDP forming)